MSCSVFLIALAAVIVTGQVLARILARFRQPPVIGEVIAGILLGLFGAFLLGAIMPHDSSLARGLIHKLRELVTILLLPAFFAFAGMRTRSDPSRVFATPFGGNAIDLRADLPAGGEQPPEIAFIQHEQLPVAGGLDRGLARLA